jgi:hypothetical protein
MLVPKVQLIPSAEQVILSFRQVCIQLITFRCPWLCAITATPAF